MEYNPDDRVKWTIPGLLVRALWEYNGKTKIYYGRILGGPVVKYDDGTVLTFSDHVASHQLQVGYPQEDKTIKWKWVRTPDMKRS